MLETDRRPDEDRAPGLQLFDYIASETSLGDRRSVLALKERAAADGEFSYLEIGSHLGGTLQPFVVDDRCTTIVSIDPRPATVPDKRLQSEEGTGFSYSGNSTTRMLSLLADIPGADVDKIVTIEAGTEAIDPASITTRPSLCFIDGEHTDLAALRDALFCLTVAPDALIAFHDRNVVGQAIAAFMRISGGYGHPLPDTLFVVDLSRRGRFDDSLRRPGLWRLANAAGAGGECAAFNSLLYLALARRPAAHRAFQRARSALQR